MSIPLLPLPYPYNSLEPELIERILKIHHDKHLGAYVENLNVLLRPYPQFADYTAEELILYIGSVPPEIQEGVWRNAGGVYNHNFYFEGMRKGGNLGPKGELLTAIIKDFGSLEDFKLAFIKKAMSLFGSGYTWLVSDASGRLSLMNTPNQDTVLLYPVSPILLIDLWEHAYYLQYENRKKEYIENWFKIIYWEKAQKRYEER